MGRPTMASKIIDVKIAGDNLLSTIRTLLKSIRMELLPLLLLEHVVLVSFSILSVAGLDV